MLSAESDDSGIDNSGVESRDEQDLNLALMARVEEGPSIIDIDVIIASKNISDSKTIELLRNIAISKNKEFKS
jgi:hypothetical protein